MENDITIDKRFMSRAIDLAKKGQFSTQPNPIVGCVITKGIEIISEGWHEKAGQNHAEIMALENCTKPTEGATCYVTLEPCTMCVGAIIHARLSKLVYAVDDPKTGACGSVFNLLQTDKLNHKVEIEKGVMEEDCRSLIQNFFKQRRQKSR